MNEKKSPHQRKAGSSREERLKAALRENLKKRKSQARGRTGTVIVTPDDDARARAAAPPDDSKD